jgi:pimeloyl-ACP methyl ester carboxylesterase
VLCAASRYARNDAALIMEKVLLDLGAYVRHAREVLGYAHVVLVGWSGGGSLALFYQSQAEQPTISETPAGDPVDIVGARLPPVDAIVYQAAHLSRARLLLDWIDPSVTDELAPDRRDVALDLYDSRNPNQPPYRSEFVAAFRSAQAKRMRRITAWVKDKLRDLQARGTAELERGFVVHRTLAEPRFLDPALDPNGRRSNWCYLGIPETVNTGPVGLARFCTLRSWLSQWSIDDTRTDALDCAPKVEVPLLVIENSADDAVPQPHPRMVYDAAASCDKCFETIDGANHYYAGQPQQLVVATSLVRRWLAERDLIEEDTA